MGIDEQFDHLSGIVNRAARMRESMKACDEASAAVRNNKCAEHTVHVYSKAIAIPTQLLIDTIAKSRQHAESSVSAIMNTPPAGAEDSVATQKQRRPK